MSKKRSIISILWIAFWAVLPAVLCLFVVFHLRAGTFPESSDPAIPSGKLYYSFYDEDLEPEPGQMVVIYIDNEKTILKVAYSEGMDITKDGYTGYYVQHSRNATFYESSTVPSGHFFVVDEDGDLVVYKTDDIWGEAVNLEDALVDLGKHFN